MMMMEMGSSNPETTSNTTTEPRNDPPDPYVRILNMAEGRRKQLFGWLDERCIYIPQLDPSPPPEDLLFSPPSSSPFPGNQPITTSPIPIEYARVCNGGSTEAWLVILQDVARPFVVVREDSLAADFMVRYRLLQQVPLCAVPVIERPQDGGAHDDRNEPMRHPCGGSGTSMYPSPASIHIQNDLKSQQDVREMIMGPRRVVFTVESNSSAPYHWVEGSYGEYYDDDTIVGDDDDDGDGDVLYDEYIIPDGEEGENGDNAKSGGGAIPHFEARSGDEAAADWLRQNDEDVLQMIEVEMENLADLMEDDAHWLVPLIRSELWKVYQERQTGPDFLPGMCISGPMTAVMSPDAAASSSSLVHDSDFESGESASPGEADGLVERGGVELDELDSRTMMNKDGIVCTSMSRGCYDDEERLFTPYEDPGALLYGSDHYSDEDENGASAQRSEYERLRREEQKRLRENIHRGFQTFLSYLHISDPPAPRSSSIVPVAGEETDDAALEGGTTRGYSQNQADNSSIHTSTTSL